MKKSEKHVIGNMCLLVATILWGYTFVVMKVGIDSIDASLILCYKYALASVVLLLLYFKSFVREWRATVKQGIVLGFFLFLASYFQLLGCQYITAGKSAFLTTSYVLIVPFLYCILIRKLPNRFMMISSVIVMTGIGLLSLDTTAYQGKGELLTLGGGVFYALHIVFIDKYAKRAEAAVLTVWQMLTCFVCCVVAVCITGNSFFVQLDWKMGLGILYLGIIGTAGGFLLQNVGQKLSEPTIASMILSLEAVFGMAASVIFLQEPLEIKKIIGCLLIFVGIVGYETRFRFFFRHLPI